MITFEFGCFKIEAGEVFEQWLLTDIESLLTLL